MAFELCLGQQEFPDQLNVAPGWLQAETPKALKATRDLVREFAGMLCHRHGEHLEAWASQAENGPVSELRGFAKGLRKDWAAVTAGLTVPYSSGPVEGHVTLKMIKRQMYGRANPDLPRKRVLLAD
ncbi:MAG TPA: hypothetical protein DHU96_12345 [Actinobacteria bacterium]|nr:hypothetical protein [Actinomycetota bacterium]